MKRYSECIFWMSWGMALQAFITAGLTAIKTIDPVPGQQFIAGCFYVLICLLVVALAKKQAAPPSAGA